MIRKIHFDTDIEMKVPVPKKIKGLVGISHKGENKYEIKVMDLKNKDIVFNKIVEFPSLKGNGRKSYAKIRDMALNAIESRPIGYIRQEN